MNWQGLQGSSDDIWVISTSECPEDPEEKSVLVVVLVGLSSENELGLVKSYIQESGVSRTTSLQSHYQRKTLVVGTMHSIGNVYGMDGTYCAISI